MEKYSRSHLADQTLLQSLDSRVAKDRTGTAELLADIAEVDFRRLFVPAGYSSMHAYCIDHLHLSEDAASKRIHAARAARQFPILFHALADGRLHLAAVCLLAPHLTAENADELVAATTHKTKSQIEQLLALRFRRPEVPAQAQPATSTLLNPQHAPGHVGTKSQEPDQALAPAQVEAGATPSGVGPIAPERFVLPAIGKSTHDKLTYARDLLSHAIPSGNLVQVLDRALEIAIRQLEKRKFGATEKPRRSPRPSPAGSRHIPAHVRNAVWERDQGRCTFVGDTGHRCSARKFLEFDHMDPVARGGQATVGRVRLLCRAHNQYEAERTFGAGFMSEKRKTEREQTVAKEQAKDVLAGLRELGVPGDKARRAAEYSETLQDATLEQRMRAALSFLAPVHRRPGTA